MRREVIAAVQVEPRGKKMADKDISLDKFTGLTAKDWIEWLEDYDPISMGTLNPQ